MHTQIATATHVASHVSNLQRQTGGHVTPLQCEIFIVFGLVLCAVMAVRALGRIL